MLPGQEVSKDVSTLAKLSKMMASEVKPKETFSNVKVGSEQIEFLALNNSAIRSLHRPLMLLRSSLPRFARAR